MVAEPVVQEVEAAQDEIEQVGVAQGALPEGERVARVGARRHRHAAQHELVLVELEPRLVGAPQAAHLGAADVVGDEADDDGRRLVARRQLLGAQHGLVEAVTAHAAIEHAPAGEKLELGGPGLGVVDLVAEGEGIAHRQDRRVGGVLAGVAQAVGIDGEAGRRVAGARHVAHLVVMDVAAAVLPRQHRARIEHEVGPGEEIDPGAGARADLARDQGDEDGGYDEQGVLQGFTHGACPCAHVPPPSYGGGGPEGRRRGKAAGGASDDFRCCVSEVAGGLPPPASCAGPLPRMTGGGVTGSGREGRCAAGLFIVAARAERGST